MKIEKIILAGFRSWFQKLVDGKMVSLWFLSSGEDCKDHAVVAYL